jgi:hypothetical protein
MIGIGDHRHAEGQLTMASGKIRGLRRALARPVFRDDLVLVAAGD